MSNEQYKKSYYQENKERMDKNNKLWREKNKDRVREYNEKYYYEHKDQLDLYYKMYNLHYNSTNAYNEKRKKKIDKYCNQYFRIEINNALKNN